MSNAKPYSGGNQDQHFTFPPQPFEGQRVTGLGQNYEFDGNQWRELAAQVDATFDFGTGLSVDESQTPPLVNLQPAQSDALGGIMEPPADGLRYYRSTDANGTSTWIESRSAEVTAALATAYVGDEEPPDQQPGLLWWQPTAKTLNIYVDRWVVIG